jgi:hypothetical protein
MSKSSKAIYLNAKQKAFAQATQKDKGLCGGRGAGKSTVNGVDSFINIIEMPKSKGAFLGLSYNQIMTKFLPPVIDMWTRMGLKEHSDKSDGHYVIGKRPPDWWAKPYQPPQYYQNVISFWNGTCIELLSFDRKNANRGGNYDWLIVDEAQLINKDRFDKEIRPSIRGNRFRFTSPRHHSISFTGSMPWLPSGFWFPDMELEMRKYPNDVFFTKATAYDNVKVLGEDYIKRLIRTLPYIVCQVEVFNERLTKLPNCFYDEFEEAKHTYFTYYDYKEDETDIIITDKDYDDEKTMQLSFDFNAKFTSVIVGQEHFIPSYEMRIINQFYEKRDINNPLQYEPTLDEVKDIISRTVQKFIDYYKGHKGYVEIWGDRNGNNAQSNSSLTFYQQIEKQLILAGFNVMLKVDRRLDPLHQLKHLVINTLLRGAANYPQIKINAERCKDLIISIQQSPLTPDFKKDKSSETQDIPQERATHLSDCFDNLIYPKYSHLVEVNTDAHADPYFM